MRPCQLILRGVDLELRVVADVSTQDALALSVWSSARRRLRLRALLAAANVEVNRPAVEAGLAVLEAGGDFADGVIACEGNWLGGETFVSFDRKAVVLLGTLGQSARLL